MNFYDLLLYNDILMSNNYYTAGYNVSTQDNVMLLFLFNVKIHQVYKTFGKKRITCNFHSCNEI